MPTRHPDPDFSAATEHDLSAALAPVVAAVATPDFLARLGSFLRQRIATDSLLALAYHRRYAPQVLFEDLDSRDRVALFERYFDGAYQLSPFYLIWLASPGEAGVYRLRDIAPEGFFDSVYFTEYYGRSGLVDEMAFLAPVDAHSAVLVSLARTERLAPFSSAERARLAALSPLVTAALTRHATLSAPQRGIELKRHLTGALTLFGSSRLTAREQQAVQLMLRGYSSKACARALGISPATERVHRRNVYAKLGVSSQAELFSLFFAALAGENPAPGADPLA